MADYKTIHGVNLRDYTTDPDTLIEGQVWYDKTNKAVQFFHPSVTSAGSWRTGGSLNSGRLEFTGAGTQTNAIAISGYLGPAPSFTTAVELYDGVSWTETADVSTARRGI